MFRSTDASRLLKRPSPAMVIACMALFMAMGGVGYAAATIGSAQIKNNSIRSVDIKGKEVKNADLANNAVTSAKVKDGSLLAKDIKAGEVVGQRGPAGANGAPGGKGDKGDAGTNGTNGTNGGIGPRGPSTAFGARVPGSVAVAGDPDEVIGGTLAAAGNYTFAAKVVLKSESALSSRPPGCELFVERGDLIETLDAVQNVSHTAENSAGDTAEYTLLALTDVAPGSGYGVSCQADPIAPLSANQRSIVVTQVAAINP